jgi:hypothetical protein
MDVDTDDIQNTGVNLDDVFKIVKVIQENAKVMMFVDECRNNPLTKGGGNSWGDERSR